MAEPKTLEEFDAQYDKSGTFGSYKDDRDVYNTWSKIDPLGEYVGFYEDPAKARQRAEAEFLRRLSLRDQEALLAQMSDPSTYILTGDRAQEFLLQDPGQVAGLYSDPRFQESQLAALRQMEDIYNSNGLTSADRERLRQGQEEQAQFLASQRAGALASAQRAGATGGNAILAAQAAGSNALSRALYAQNAQVAGDAADRALRAIEGANSMASGLRGQSYGEALNRANAFDQWRNNERNIRLGLYQDDLTEQRARQRDIEAARTNLNAVRAQHAGGLIAAAGPTPSERLGGNIVGGAQVVGNYYSGGALGAAQGGSSPGGLTQNRRPSDDLAAGQSLAGRTYG